MSNDWNNMPQAYFEHIAECRSQPIISAHRSIARKSGKDSKRNTAQMKEYRRGVVVCERCHGATPTETHHVIPISKGGEDVRENYMAVCLSCHRALRPNLPDILFIRKACRAC